MKENFVVTRSVQTRIGSVSANCDVAVIGAGPYGLSAGAHLKAKGIETCVFGEPMEFWANTMPEGMLLRSPRVASSLSDPDGAFTLEAYEAASKREPCAPVPLDTFVEYGRWFRHQLGSDLDQRTVLRVDRDQPGFRLTLQDGEEIRSTNVVIAAGIGPFKRKARGVPEPFPATSNSLLRGSRGPKVCGEESRGHRCRTERIRIGGPPA